MIRQLATSRFRPTVRTANGNTACIIVNPNTYGFNQRFPGKLEKLDDLKGAKSEGDAIAESLRNAGWNDNDIVITPPEQEALEIFNVLYKRPYRVLSIAAHGLFEAEAKDGRAYTGVVLSDGLLITAVEISQMEVVPEIVFLNCCHLGVTNSSSSNSNTPTLNPYSKPNYLAYSLARKLIEMGVRCVVATGWAVNDDAACTFASTFFDSLCRGQTFGDAIFNARNVTYQQHQGSNTWGAYQAYGDPSYRLHIDTVGPDGGGERAYVAIEQLLSELHRRKLANKNPKPDAKPPSYSGESKWVGRLLAKCPPDWAETPGVLQAVAELYADLGGEGFEAAHKAYLRAVQMEDLPGRVAVKALEQLANLEARRGGKLIDAGKPDEGLALIEQGLRRIEQLSQAVAGEGASESNPERAAILGSAYKLKAAALSGHADAEWAEIKPALCASASAYWSAVSGNPATKPYNTLNYLQMAWLSETLIQGKQESVDLANRCGEQARKTFAINKDIWAAVMSADAQMTAWLLGGKLPPDEAGAESKPAEATPAKVLQRIYDEAVKSQPLAPREWDSVVKQWRLLARFLRMRAQENLDEVKAKEFDALAEHYAPNNSSKPATNSAAKPADKRAKESGKPNKPPLTPEKK